MEHHMPKSRACSVVSLTAWLVLGLSVPLHAIPMGTLIGPPLSPHELSDTKGSIRLDDKRFFNFDGRGSDIVVQGVRVEDTVGLRFSGPFEASGNASVTHNFNFQVRITDPTVLLHDVRHTFTAEASGRNIGVRVISEVLTPSGSAEFLQTAQRGLQTGSFDNTRVFASDVSEVFVKQLIGVEAVGQQDENGNFVPGGSVTVPFVNVTFSQTIIPSPRRCCSSAQVLRDSASRRGPERVAVTGARIGNKREAMVASSVAVKGVVLCRVSSIW